MTAAPWMRMLTPLGWLTLAGVAVAALVALALATGWRWDPFDLQHRRFRAAEDRAILARAQAAVLQRQVQGEVDQAARVDRHHQQALAVVRATTSAVAAARKSDEDPTPLEAVRAGRLRAHDDELCRLAPGVCGPAPVERAGGGDHAVRAGAPAGRADPG